MKKLPESVKTVWLYSAIITIIVEIIIFTVATIGVKYLDWKYVEYILPVLGTILVVWALVDMISIPYRYAFHQYAIHEDRVEIKNGFIFREQVTVPIARVQNVDIEQGPILRHKNLYKISIYTSADSHEIAAVTKEESENIKTQVMRLAMEARNAR
ncbi:hypothetical protein AKUH3B101J_12800 [Apilactobacillus kunkeei]|uniref:PH domain-containing protein n=1 Tax=Apilactobacillus kunkeei TaxID=148814 RepID=UPI0006CE7D5D|nr:PH domain-containing protein [Apilactobacillus kunkeei]KPN81788.1 hypothetical protein RZ77_02920 [Apilactobacillus kunkeei]MCK8619991.1 PH domain-containing protein [Apilactobacillus kunkeei]MCK8625465.1 PH domain-containing protein [Apilactobacillus kunkeei]TPR54876.1 hypothetical protein DY036_00640 [Apilactobacillus kunkeei]WJV43205.1 PH domain-containing protein [Apilactobacillus kunkeei]